MSIPTNSERSLLWYFENRYLPDAGDSLHGSMVGAIRKTVTEFVRFAGCDPALGDITLAVLAEFEQLGRRKFTASVAKNRRGRIEAILSHANVSTPVASQPSRVALAPPVEGSLRWYAKHENKSKDNITCANRFSEWYGGDIPIASVTRGMIDAYEESVGRNLAWRVRTLLRTFDPVKFRRRNAGATPSPVNRGNGSEFLLWNIYEKRYEPTALRSRALNTKRLYRTTIKKFGEYLKRDANLDDLNDETVSAYAAWRLRKVCKHSMNKDLFNLLAIWRWCHRKSLLTNWPDVEMEKAPRRSPIAWSEAELRKLYAALSTLPGKVGKLPACDWWTALLLVAWDTGERIGAIIHLDWSNVDLRKQWVRFPAEDRKGGGDDSAVRLSDDAVSALRKIQTSEGLVFPWPNCYTYLWRRYGEILKAAGLPCDHKSKFHRIRKSVASHAEAAGANATAMLRHSKREITEAYLDPKIVTRQQPADVLFRLAN